MHTLNSEVKVSLILSSRVGHHTSVLSFMGKHGILYVEEVTTLLNASLVAPSQQLDTNIYMYIKFENLNV